MDPNNIGFNVKHGDLRGGVAPCTTPVESTPPLVMCVERIQPGASDPPNTPTAAPPCPSSGLSARIAALESRLEAEVGEREANDLRHDASILDALKQHREADKPRRIAKGRKRWACLGVVLFLLLAGSFGLSATSIYLLKDMQVGKRGMSLLQDTRGRYVHVADPTVTFNPVYGHGRHPRSLAKFVQQQHTTGEAEIAQLNYSHTQEIREDYCGGALGTAFVRIETTPGVVKQWEIRVMECTPTAIIGHYRGDAFLFHGCTVPHNHLIALRCPRGDADVCFAFTDVTHICPVGVGDHEETGVRAMGKHTKASLNQTAVVNSVIREFKRNRECSMDHATPHCDPQTEPHLPHVSKMVPLQIGHVISAPRRNIYGVQWRMCGRSGHGCIGRSKTFSRLDTCWNNNDCPDDWVCARQWLEFPGVPSNQPAHEKDGLYGSAECMPRCARDDDCSPQHTCHGSVCNVRTKVYKECKNKNSGCATGSCKKHSQCTPPTTCWVGDPESGQGFCYNVCTPKDGNNPCSEGLECVDGLCKDSSTWCYFGSECRTNECNHGVCPEYRKYPRLFEYKGGCDHFGYLVPEGHVSCFSSSDCRRDADCEGGQMCVGHWRWGELLGTTCKKKAQVCADDIDCGAGEFCVYFQCNAWTPCPATYGLFRFECVPHHADPANPQPDDKYTGCSTDDDCSGEGKCYVWTGGNPPAVDRTGKCWAPECIRGDFSCLEDVDSTLGQCRIGKCDSVRDCFHDSHCSRDDSKKCDLQRHKCCVASSHTTWVRRPSGAVHRIPLSDVRPGDDLLATCPLQTHLGLLHPALPPLVVDGSAGLVGTHWTKVIRVAHHANIPCLVIHYEMAEEGQWRAVTTTEEHIIPVWRRAPRGPVGPSLIPASQVRPGDVLLVRMEGGGHRMVPVVRVTKSVTDVTSVLTESGWMDATGVVLSTAIIHHHAFQALARPIVLAYHILPTSLFQVLLEYVGPVVSWFNWKVVFPVLEALPFFHG